jgi:hypothetical protein
MYGKEYRIVEKSIEEKCDLYNKMSYAQEKIIDLCNYSKKQNDKLRTTLENYKQVKECRESE